MVFIDAHAPLRFEYFSIIFLPQNDGRMMVPVRSRQNLLVDDDDFPACARACRVAMPDEMKYFIASAFLASKYSIIASFMMKLSFMIIMDDQLSRFQAAGANFEINRPFCHGLALAGWS